MVTSKIILFLRKLSKKELSRFREYLCSPYFNNKNTLVKFYDNLNKYAPEFNNKTINRAKIYENLYPSSTFNMQVYKNLSSELYSMARDFIALQNFNKNQIEKDLSLLNGLEQIEVDELYKTELKSTKKKLSEKKFNDFIFFYKFNLAMIERTFYINKGNFEKVIDIGIEESDELLKFYLIHLFRQRFDFEAARLNFNIQYPENSAMRHMNNLIEKGVLEETINCLIEKKSKNHEIVAMFYYILMSLKNYDNDYFFYKAKELVFSNINKFDSDERFSVSAALYGLCSFKQRLRGSKSDYENTFDVINFRLNKKIYKENDDSHISAISFRAMFMTGVYLNKFDWAKRLLKKHIIEVPLEHRENLNNLLTAFLKFYEKKFDESLKYSSLVKYDLFIYKIDVRKLQLFNYYELNHLESALSLISSFKEFLSNNKNVTEDSGIKHLNLLNFTSKLIKLKNEFNEYELLKLEKNIEKTKYLLYRWWLEEKIEQLKKYNKK